MENLLEPHNLEELEDLERIKKYGIRQVLIHIQLEQELREQLEQVALVMMVETQVLVVEFLEEELVEGHLLGLQEGVMVEILLVVVELY